MSRIGKKPIQVPAGVKVAVHDGTLQVEGKKSKLTSPIPPGIRFEVSGSQVVAYRDSEEKPYPAYHGLARALAAKPKLLLLDEPAAGVPSSETHLVAGVVERLPADIAVLLIDHDMELVFRLARRITVMAEGRILVEGRPDEIARDPQVRQVYLGERVVL